MFRETLFRCTLYCLALIVLAPPRAGAGNFRQLYSFTGSPDGAVPLSTLTKDRSGNLYGSTYSGGGSTVCSGGCGTIFRLAPDGSESVVHSFSWGDGANPEGGIVFDKVGNLYSTTVNGGTAGRGTIFRLAPDGTETVLYSLANGSDSSAPTGELTMDRKGNLFGTASGLNVDSGSVFELAADGTFTTLHSFKGVPDGASPFGGIIADSGGNLYGTTTIGGMGTCGTVFKLAKDGTLTVLHAFAGGADGASPWGTVAMDAGGNLFGTTTEGSGYDCDGGGCGTIFKIAPDGTETILFSFDNAEQGSWPMAPVLIGQNGDLYGTASGTPGGCGTVFRLNPEGTMKVLHAFHCGSGGYAPWGGLLADHGQLFGTTQSGGEGSGYGVVFSVRR